MKNRIGIVGLLLVLIVCTVSVRAASPDAATANLPWTVEKIKDGVSSGVTNVTTTFGRNDDFPILSWNDNQIIYHAFPVTPFFTGNCGPGNSWKCYGISAQSGDTIVAGTVSNMASYHLINTYLVGWAYKTTSNKIQGVVYEYSDAGDYLTRYWVDLVDLNIFGLTVVGAPSIEIIDAKFRLAVAVIKSGGDFPLYQLVYMYRSGTVNTSCRSTATTYQCEVLEQSVSTSGIGAPSLDWVAVDSVGLAYYKSGGGVKYAYPHTTVGTWTANGGPDPKAWRCISIYGASGTVGHDVKFHFGKNSLARGIAFTYNDAMIENTLFYAEHVGSGGNCGADKNAIGLTVNKWTCTDVDLLTFNPSPSFSVAVDEQGYGMIAYNNALGDFSTMNLYLAYPKARTGSPDPGWIREKIDGAPTTSVRTGAETTLSLSENGLGLIGYLQEEDYMLPDVKVAMQSFVNYMPLVKR